MDQTISPAELDRLRATGGRIVLLDVRRNVDFDADDVVIPGAHHVDPEHTDDWAQSLKIDEPIVIYCVRGGSVSQSVSERLLELGNNVRYIEGGITAWKAQGGVGTRKSSR